LEKVSDNIEDHADFLKLREVSLSFRQDSNLEKFMIRKFKRVFCQINETQLANHNLDGYFALFMHRNQMLYPNAHLAASLTTDQYSVGPAQGFHRLGQAEVDICVGALKHLILGKLD
jgi:hypothetical protein